MCSAKDSHFSQDSPHSFQAFLRKSTEQRVGHTCAVSGTLTTMAPLCVERGWAGREGGRVMEKREEKEREGGRGRGRGREKERVRDKTVTGAIQ